MSLSIQRFIQLGMVVMAMVHTTAYADTTALPSTHLPAVNAQYLTTQCERPCAKPLKKQWWLMRAANQVELRDVDSKTGQLSGQGELWRRAPDGKMAYWYLMHDDKRVIEYLFGDLRVLGIKTDESQWQMLTQIVPDHEKANLQRRAGKPTRYMGHIAERFSGVINGVNVQLTWLPEFHVPAMVEYQYPKRKVTVKLTQLRDATTADSAAHLSPNTDDAALSQYQQVYYTDIGDMEQNDEVKAWLVHATGAPGLHAHHH